MVVQHNGMALNAYNQLGLNLGALAKNVQKLSSGFRINSAADDAAGLAISEKMRAQIRGLEAAQKNAADSISLIQTAEGALKEVHDILGRMNELAVQSAHGIYDDYVDRAAMDAEFQQLKEEINRISQATNFNGINLLDGSLGGGASVNAAAGIRFTGDLADIFSVRETAPVAAVQAEYTIDFGVAFAKYANEMLGLGIDFASVTEIADLATDGALTNVNVAELKAAIQASLGDMAKDYDIDLGTGPTIDFTATAASGSSGAVTLTAKNAGIDANRNNVVTNEFSAFYEAVTGAESYRDVRLTIDLEKLGDTDLIGKTFTLNGKTFQFTGQGDSNNMDVTLNGEDIDFTEKDGTTGVIAGANQVLGGMKTKDGDNYSVYIGGARDVDKVAYMEDVMKAMVEVFNSVEAKNAGWTQTQLNEFFGTDNDIGTAGITSDASITDQHITNWVFAPGTGSGEGGQVTAEDIAKLGGAFAGWENVDGMGTIRIYSSNVDAANAKAGISGSMSGSGSITFQVGDTADSYNRVGVSINDMSTKGLNINNLSIDTEANAVIAMGTKAQQAIPGSVKGAINLVSTQRATLGAMQNRLDHTINNISVTTENLMAAESRIRHLDMAKEMMAFTKNNVAVQAAQAMLAQSSQLTQLALRMMG